MTKKILALITAPLLLFGTIEVANEVAAKKSSSCQEKTMDQANPADRLKQKNQNKTPEVTIDDDSLKPEATTPNFIDPSYQKQFFRTLIFLCILIIFGMIIVYIYKRSSPMSVISKKNGRGNIKILERRSLSSQTQLYHVEVGDKQFILSESKVEVRNVSTLDWPDR
ncbi:MAG: hypothetical protein S4CHLAM20_08500 [Chlamydiia bacterium]|nr:hypothetical protein [Chlamydiia bacterium]